MLKIFNALIEGALIQNLPTRIDYVSHITNYKDCSPCIRNFSSIDPEWGSQLNNIGINASFESQIFARENDLSQQVKESK